MFWNIFMEGIHILVVDMDLQKKRNVRNRYTYVECNYRKCTSDTNLLFFWACHWARFWTNWSLFQTLWECWSCDPPYVYWDRISPNMSILSWPELGWIEQTPQRIRFWNRPVSPVKGTGWKWRKENCLGLYWKIDSYMTADYVIVILLQQYIGYHEWCLQHIG